MVRILFFGFSLGAPILVAVASIRFHWAWWAFLLVGPIIFLGLYDVLQTKHSLLRIYPVIGHGRYFFEEVRPEIQQYFVESNIDGTPFSREFRSLIYQRSKKETDTVPFGTQRDVDAIGYEWMTHSLAPRPPLHEEPRVEIGGRDCAKPYRASHLNISAMSFGSLSKNAIRALNRGAKLGGFAHNTGEGGLSPYHLEEGGDLIWQIGTGYFGCRSLDGHFDEAAFTERVTFDVVKMIEIKLSQGAKPGHGGILPGAKVSREIAEIRGVRPGHDVISPPAHSTFSTPAGLLRFVARLRELSEGKPVGFKLCVGHRTEFLGICKAMLQTGILPDFITVDGAEGGTGAAPVELSDSVGMPLRDGLLFVHAALTGIDLRDQIRVIAAGKVSTGFHMVRAMALGANACNSARSMMFALGCIQARRCNTNQCPVGITTQQPSRVQGLVVDDKAQRVARYHRATVAAFLELIASNGLATPAEIRPRNLLKRVATTDIRSFDEVYEYLSKGVLLDERTIPASWRDRWQRASGARFDTAPWSRASGRPST